MPACAKSITLYSIVMTAGSACPVCLVFCCSCYPCNICNTTHIISSYVHCLLSNLSMSCFICLFQPESGCRVYLVLHYNYTLRHVIVSVKTIEKNEKSGVDRRSGGSSESSAPEDIPGASSAGVIHPVRPLTHYFDPSSESISDQAGKSLMLRSSQDHTKSLQI